jgi:hypothetical protein
MVEHVGCALGRSLREETGLRRSCVGGIAAVRDSGTPHAPGRTVAFTRVLWSPPADTELDFGERVGLSITLNTVYAASSATMQSSRSLS